jgi:nicotinate phosphoribosyltransferase
MAHTRILGSGALDAHRIASLVQQKAPIDVFAVGSALTDGITGDGPQLCYRMAALIRGTSPVPVRGHWSSHWPSVKQVFRYPEFDLVCSEVESTEQMANGGTAILVPWVINGERVQTTQTLDQQRAHCERTLSALPSGVRRLVNPEPFPVRASDTLAKMRL